MSQFSQIASLEIFSNARLPIRQLPTRIFFGIIGLGQGSETLSVGLIGGVSFRLQAGFVISDLVFNLMPAPFGAAVTGANTDVPPERFKRKMPAPDGFHDGASGDAPADTNLLEIIDQIFLSVHCFKPDF